VGVGQISLPEVKPILSFQNIRQVIITNIRIKPKHGIPDRGEKCAKLRGRV
jgi:hypothetical protein